MSFDTAIAKPSSHRFMLVRLEPARHVSGDLALASGVYEMAISDPVFKVTRNGTDLTEVAVTPTTNDTWQWDGSTLKVKLASAPDDESNIIVIRYYLFFTGTEGRTAPETPTDSDTDPRLWRPRLIQNPSLTRTFKNVRQGLLTVPDLSVDFINTDQFFEDHLTAEHTFFDKAVRVWLCVDSIDNIRAAFIGKIKSVSLETGTCSFSARNALADLDIPATIGTTDEAYLTAAASHVTAVRNQDYRRPVPYIFGTSRYRLGTELPIEIYAFINAASFGYSRRNYLMPSSMEEALNINYDDEPGKTDNREWLICRSTDFKTLDFGTVTAATLQAEDYNTGTGVVGITYVFGPARSYRSMTISTTGHNIEVGDSWTWSSAAIGGGTLSAIATAVTPTGLSCVINSISSSPPTDDVNTDLTPITLNTNQAPALIYENPSLQPAQRLMFYGEDYTASTVTMANGDKALKITLENSFENDPRFDVSSSDGSNPALDPDECKIYYRATQKDSDRTHGQVVQKLLETGSDLEVDTASITAADSALTANCAFSVPEFDESDFGDVSKYLGQVLQGTLGYIYVTTEGKFYYQLIEAPAAGTKVTSSYYQGLSIEIDYEDLVTDLVFYNAHLGELASADKASRTESSEKLRHLYGKTIVKRFRHVLDDISGRSDAIFQSLANRRAVYEFTGPQTLLKTELGDDLTLSTARVLGLGSSDNLKVIAVQTTGSAVAIQAEDLEGIS